MHASTVVASLLWLGVGAFGLCPDVSAGDKPCICQSKDGAYPEGSLVCLTINGRQRLARCTRVLNNTSWTVIGDTCPLAAQTPPIDSVAHRAPKGPRSSPSPPHRPGA